jgi:adenylylsulfate kinase
LENIHPIFHTILSQEKKEELLRQRAIVVWLLGLSGSGKSTIARSVENNLHKMGYLTKLLDGDNLRSGINNNLGFSPEDRSENIRRAAEVSKLFAQCGVVTICSLICPTHELQSLSRKIIGNDLYFEVFVNCPVEVCEQRDVKGLYAKARAGEIKEFTGISAPFDEPTNPDLILNTDKETLENSQEKVLNALLKRISF